MSPMLRLRTHLTFHTPGPALGGRPSDRAGTLLHTPFQATVLCGSSIEKLRSTTKPHKVLSEGVPSYQFQ